MKSWRGDEILDPGEDHPCSEAQVIEGLATEEIQAELRTIPPPQASDEDKRNMSIGSLVIDLMALLGKAGVSNMYSDDTRVALNFDTAESAGVFSKLLDQYHALLADPAKVDVMKQARLELLAASLRYNELLKSLAHPERIAYEKWDKERVEAEGKTYRGTQT